MTSIDRLGDGALEILNLVISKPDIPSDIAHNYMQVTMVSLCYFDQGESSVDTAASGSPETEDNAD